MVFFSFGVSEVFLSLLFRKRRAESHEPSNALTPIFPSFILNAAMLQQVPTSRLGRKRLVVLGGGTGTFTILSGLKKHPIDISAVVNISDDGGSTGVLRDELGVLPPGDIRQCLVALSNADDALRELFLYRFPNESLRGHNFGNLFISALEKIVGDPIKAINVAHQILRVRGRVIPVSRTPATLEAVLSDGSVLRGERVIDARDSLRPPIRRCWLQPNVQVNPAALDAINNADTIVIGPGDVYTSIVPVILVSGIASAIAESKATVIHVVNLASKPGQTDGFTASEHVQALQNYLSPATLDVVIMNNAKPSPALAERYKEQGECPVEDDLRNVPYRVWRGALISDTIRSQLPEDKIQRSLLRHDPDKLAQAIMDVIA